LVPIALEFGLAALDAVLAGAPDADFSQLPGRKF
jgi:hypothetical protein